ncbi:MAG TPA: serine/threonine-protein kinase [Kofleriaceae bacterium]|nr:serine/threonine-protein kinase [Kofleriaceae bacterium]
MTATRGSGPLDEAGHEDPTSWIGGNRYRAIRVIATGGTGDVIEADDTELGRRIAIKCARRGASSDPLVQEMLRREARLTGRLEHPNIVPIYDAGSDERGGRYYVMRLLDQPTLETVLIKLAAGEPETLAIYSIGRLLNDFLQVCRAVDYANSCGVIHCDLKPANILLGRYGEVLVVDWGLATDLRDQTGFRGGTPGYMAPEQIDPNGSLDARTDVFALGVILYEILSLHSPFDAEGDTEVRTLVREYVAGEWAPPPPGRLRTIAVPREIEEICMMGLDPDPAGRFASAGEMARAVEAALFGFARLP